MNARFHRNTFSCFVIITWWKNQEYLFAGMPFYSASQAVSTPALVMIEETQNSNERGDGVTQMCCCSQKPACIESEHAHTRVAAHKALDPRIDSSTTQSSQLSTNPSIAGWLGSNHHSQSGWNKRMACWVWGNPLPYEIDGTSLGLVHEASCIVTNIPLRISDGKQHRRKAFYHFHI